MKQTQQQMLQYVNAVSFAQIDAALYLDTHPCDEEALAHYQHYTKLREKAVHEYAQNYGPLTFDLAGADCRRWDWVENPWPWNMGGDC